MKIKCEDGNNYLVVTGIGNITRAIDLEHAEKLESYAFSAMMWGVSLGVIIPISASIGFIMYGCS